jgi:gamma-glutamyltranspeptidase/glutathione hydrolase
VTDPAFENVPVEELLSKVRVSRREGRQLTPQPYLQKRAALIDLKKVIPVKHGNPINSSDTIYLSTSDSEGNACSFIASNYAGTSPTIWRE